MKEKANWKDCNYINFVFEQDKEREQLKVTVLLKEEEQMSE